MAATPSSPSGTTSSEPLNLLLPLKRVLKSSLCVLCSAATWAGVSCDVVQKPSHIVAAQASTSSRVGVSSTRKGGGA